MGKAEVIPFNIAELAKKNIAEMAKQANDMEVGEDGKGYPQIKDAHVQIKGLKKKVVDRHKELKSVHLKKCQKLDSDKREINGFLDPIILVLADKRKAWDEKKRQEKEKKELAEMKRVQDIQVRLSELRSIRFGMGDKTAEELDTLWETLGDTEITENIYGEFKENALEIFNELVADLEKATVNRKRMDLEDELRKAEIKKLEELRIQQEKEQAKIDKANAKIDADKAALKEKERVQKLKAQAKVQAEKDLEKKLKDAKKQELLAEEKKKRTEELRPDKEKLVEWINELFEITPPKIIDEKLAEIATTAISEIHETARKIALTLKRIK